ncbi:putative bifunctional diguanylate cyclase/phosphodiesterase [Aliivibrio kagoshimensis]|uniref:putative bifunctional diguanylate cyclase/phosphodiesterase n=1 Tax=Aliivibrio kagoshimensis TaxID=2910230 RepID=UPI003D0CB182
MLYLESKRLGRSTVIAFTIIAVIILSQGGVFSWKMHQITSEFNSELATFSNSKVTGLKLKNRLMGLRALEKDILLNTQNPDDLHKLSERWRIEVKAARIQFEDMDHELQSNVIYDGRVLATLSTEFYAYNEGISFIITAILNSMTLSPMDAYQTAASYQQYITNMDEKIDEIIVKAEDFENETLKRLEQRKKTLFWNLGLFSFISALLTFILSIVTFRRNMHISKTLEHHALHDALTGMFNRRGLSMVMSDNTRGGVLVHLDFNRFKLINDLCGHTVGDELLVSLSKKMRELCKQSKCTLARVGGDEFVVWLDNTNSTEKAHLIAKQLITLIESHEFYWMEQSITLGASAGIAVGKPNFLFTELVSRADAACRLAKIPGNENVVMYEESDPLLLAIRKEEQWAAKIPHMLLESRFKLYGQCIVPLQHHTQTGHIEVLLRGLDDNGEIVPPGMFLPAAERFGLMGQIDRWVINCLLSNHLKDDIHYSVNISAHTLADVNYLSELIAMISQSGKGHQLIFEITETSAMTNIKTAREYITSLKALGCRFSLDDFGSGFSSFAYLRDLNVDYLKIDGSLIKILGSNESDTALVQAIVNMAKSLNLETIAEYVEHPQLASLLYDMKVDFGQGYGLHNPEPLELVTLLPTMRVRSNLQS